jgi:Ca2+/Na+ antiporter
LASPLSPVERASGIASLLAASFFAYRITRTSDDVTTAGEPFGETLQLVASALVAYAVVGVAMLAGGLLFEDEGAAAGKSLAIAGLLAGIWCWHRRFEIRAWAAGLDEPANDDGNTYGRLVLVLLGGVTGFPLFLWLGPVAGFLGLWIPTMLFLIVTWLLARPGRASGH